MPCSCIMELNNKHYLDGKTKLCKRYLMATKYIYSLRESTSCTSSECVLILLFLRAGAGEDKSKGVGYNIGESDEYGSRV